ncbi:hypothetical protein [Nocardia acidivorans]|uniref:hypothetical protein n=1 Tax=Nocardia acidivorans TaxID=404580 RepID=UPI00082A970D|nr:hypothetical protein [Nocardia acidivorans]
MRTLRALGAADMERQFLRQAGWTLQRPGGAPFLEFATPKEESDRGWRTDYQFCLRRADNLGCGPGRWFCCRAADSDAVRLEGVIGTS